MMREQTDRMREQIEYQNARLQAAIMQNDEATRREFATKVDLANAKYDIFKWILLGIAFAQTAIMIAIIGIAVIILRT